MMTITIRITMTTQEFGNKSNFINIINNKQLDNSITIWHDCTWLLFLSFCACAQYKEKVFWGGRLNLHIYIDISNDDEDTDNHGNNDDNEDTDNSDIYPIILLFSLFFIMYIYISLALNTGEEVSIEKWLYIIQIKLCRLFTEFCYKYYGTQLFF